MPCAQQAQPALYGLGIRTAFYLLWYGTILASWAAPAELPLLRLATSLFIGGEFLSLVILASDGDRITAVDAYVMLVLTYGTYFALVPRYLWGALTGWNPFWDPGRWPRVPMTGVFVVVEMLGVAAVTSFLMWFWTGGRSADVLCGDGDGNGGWGFFFAQVPIDAGLFVAVNIVFVVVVLVGVAVGLGMRLGVCWPPRWVRRRERRFEREVWRAEERGEEYAWRRTLQFWASVVETSVVSVVVVAVELTVQWNGLVGVGDVDTAAQTIPLVVAAGLLARVVYAWFFPGHDRKVRKALSARRKGLVVRPEKGFGMPPGMDRVYVRQERVYVASETVEGGGEAAAA
ncbi:hypothetical protein B0T22DRAFT_509020 [Podospora appendiculata]|uniref:Uncharacterized protein n=1 Tax=Podospora appendiculata TaxID=314037 RepID=A0AAE1CIF2_9PEZI|nr:hypothetical protein B0T22DRAFT_509020 [Podospora appendiculata]